jgi:hypothetical protein
MINAWIVIREENCIDAKYWVCLNKDDALKIAKDVTEYWKDESDEVDTELYEDMIYNYSAEDSFSVIVQPQQIREPGETNDTLEP